MCLISSCCLKENALVFIDIQSNFFLPPYLCCLIQHKAVGNYLLCSQSYYNLHVAPARTNLCKTALKYAALSSKKLRLNHLVPFSHFKTLMREIEKDLVICKTWPGHSCKIDF